jgi:dolichol-phosphate mannosyltransferase
MHLDYSVIIPVKNEEGNVEILLSEVEQSLSSFTESWELIFVDDGSTDNSVAILERLKPGRPFLKILSLDKNHGQSTAMLAGFKEAKGEKIISLDGDRQNDPKDIIKLVEAMGNSDLICGWRKERKDTFFKRLISKTANAIRSSVCKDGLHDTGCTLKVYRRSALLSIPTFNGMHRFLPALFVLKGFKIKELPVSHRDRGAGVSHYNLLNRGFGTIIDMIGVRWLRTRNIAYSIKESKD